MSATTRTDNANTNHNQALIAAIRNRQLDTVRNLLEHDIDNIDIDGGDPTPLREACHTGDVRFVDLLLEYGADPNYEVEEIDGVRYYSHQNPLICFATNDIMSRLLKSGYDPNVFYRKSVWRPLHQECSDAHYDKIELLLQHGANPNLPGPYGMLPVFEISSSANDFNFNENHLKCLRLLLEYGANPNVIEPHWGHTPLFQFIFKARGECRLDVIRLMMQHGTDVTIPLSMTPWNCANCIKGDTTLHAAVRLVDVDAVRLMTESQATTMFWWLRNNDGDTVYDLAAKLEAAPIIEYLDMKLRQECLTYLLNDWIPISCEGTMTSIHRIDENAAGWK